MANSFKATNEQINDIVKYYMDYSVEVTSDTISFKAVYNSTTVLVYNNNTVLFQGSNAKDELAKWYESEEEIIDHLGSDEVGCGDYFGPVVVVSSLVKKEDYEYLKSLGVNDSKKISDETIQKIAPLIKEKVKSVSFILTNEKYNELTLSKDFNLNKLKAYMHNFVLYKLVSTTNFKGKIIVDQFCEEELYYKYLLDYKTKDIQRNIYFTTKAESKYLAVACSSIIARDIFLKEIDKMSNELNKKVILGASDKVDDLAYEILKEKGPDYLKKYTKWHFKNTNKILEKDSLF